MNVSSFTSSPHVGTHADAPLHVREGSPASDTLPFEAFLGAVTIVDVSAIEDEISMGFLDDAISESRCERLLLKTGHTIASGAFPSAWPSLSEACAQALSGRHIRLLGVDAPSVDSRESKKLPVHRALFAADVCVVENLDLRGIAPGDYELIALPLKIAGLDATPVRALLRDLRI